MIPNSCSSKDVVPDGDHALHRFRADTIIDSLIDHAVFAVSPAGNVMS